MNFCKFVPFGALAITLSACGGAVELGPIAHVPQFADSAADTVEVKAVNGGVSGAVAGQTGTGGPVTRRDLMIELSSDLNTATVTLDGTRFVLTSATPDPAEPSETEYVDGSGLRLLLAPTGNGEEFVNFFVFYDGATIHDTGFAGAETRIENLPSDNANYVGLFRYFVAGIPSDPDLMPGDNGTFDILVDFGTGAVTGNLTNLDDQVSPVTGNVTGNGFAADVTVTDTEMSGTIQMDGTFFGPGADEVGGTFSGDVQVSGGTRDVFGIFGGRNIPILP